MKHLIPIFTFVAFVCISAKPMVSYFGGSGDDAAGAAAFFSNAEIAIGGTSSSETIWGESGTRLEDGAGFIARFSSDAQTLQWFVRLEQVQDMVINTQGDIIVRCKQSIAFVKGDGSGFFRDKISYGTDVADFSLTPDGRMAVIAGGRVYAYDPAFAELWSRDVGRSHVLSVAMSPTDYTVWVGGDQNTNTGFEPWRSPFLYQFAADGSEVLQRLYTWKGPDVRADGKQLQADSFIKFLTFSADGRLWMSGGSDGGNTVLMKEPDNLDVAQDALSGTCFPGACHGYKGAKKTGMFARMTEDGSDLERASWVVPYVEMKPGSHLDPPCGCKGPAFNRDTKNVNPGSFELNQLFPLADGVLVIGNPWGVGPATENGWFYNTHYPKGGIGWIGKFTPDLSEISWATMVPGSKNMFGAVQGSRLLLTGWAKDYSSITLDPAEAGWDAALPTSPDAQQKEYAGGNVDAFIVLGDLEQLASDTRFLMPAAPGSVPVAVHTSGKDLVFSHLSAGSVIKLYSMQGKLLQRVETDKRTLRIPLHQASMAGIYSVSSPRGTFEGTFFGYTQ